VEKFVVGVLDFGGKFASGGVDTGGSKLFSGACMGEDDS
jgi:hypothetical protein